jgi:polyferredoxin
MPDGKKVQPAKRGKISNPWVFARKITQTAAFTAFVLTVVFTRFNGLEPAISALPVRLSPLAMFAHLLSSRTFLAGSTISLVILISSFVVGRAWCGWLCPMGTILDVFSFNHSRIKKQLPDNWRKLKYGLLIVTLVSAVFSNLTLLFFDPITLFVRTITVTVLPVIDQITFAVEKLFIKVPFLSGPVSKFDSLIRPAIFPSEPSTFVYAFTFGLFFTGLILLNLIAERFWCRYLCPLGAMLGLASKIALIQRRLESPCAECGLCSKKCPTGTINPALNFKSDPSECTLCMECQQRCAKGSQSFPARWQPARFNSYDPDRRLFLGSLGLSIFSLALLNIGNKRQDAKDHLLRPPGVDGATFLSKCVRSNSISRKRVSRDLEPPSSSRDMGFASIRAMPAACTARWKQSHRSKLTKRRKLLSVMRTSTITAALPGGIIFRASFARKCVRCPKKRSLSKKAAPFFSMAIRLR